MQIGEFKRTLFFAESDWCNVDADGVKLLHGFLPPGTQQQLNGQPDGTFMFRFSASMPGKFAVDYVDGVEPKSALLKADRPGVSFTSNSGKDFMYSSLEHLARDYGKFKQRLGVTFTK